MKEIFTLGFGFCGFIVDDEDYGWLNQYTWNVSSDGYATINYKSKIFNDIAYFGMSMSRLILGLEYGDQRQADHINHNVKDNRRQNLRIVTCSQNQANRKIRYGGTSKYKGVYWHKKDKKWRAKIVVNGKPIYLGNFNNENHAAHAYNLAAKRHFDQYALLNKVV